MKKIILLLILCFVFNNSVQAGFFELSPRKVLIGTTITASVGASIGTVVWTVVTGNGLDKSIKIVNISAKTETGKKFYEDFLLNLVLRTRYSKYPKRAHNAMDILQGSNLYTPTYEKRAEKEFSDYDATVKLLTARADKIKRKNFCLGRYLIYVDGMVLKPEKGVQDVQEWDYGSYLYLENIDLEGDNLEHDHIPSIQAIFTYLEKRDANLYGKLKRKYKKGDKNQQGIVVMNNATAIEVKNSLHHQGRTWFWKQGKKVKDTASNSLKKLYEADAENLYLATILDFTEYVIIQKGLTPLMAEAFDATILRNTKLCLYE